MSVLSPPAVAIQDLVRFLLARLDEDTAELKRIARQEARGERVDGVRDTDRLQAEVAAKRRVIGTLQQLLVLRDQPAEKTVRDSAALMLRVLAVPYDAHANYRPEWRPSAAH